MPHQSLALFISYTLQGQVRSFRHVTYEGNDFDVLYVGDHCQHAAATNQ